MIRGTNLQNLTSRSVLDNVSKKVSGIKPIADEVGVPPSQLTTARCASNPKVSSVITGAAKEFLGCLAMLYNQAVFVFPHLLHLFFLSIKCFWSLACCCSSYLLSVFEI